MYLASVDAYHFLRSFPRGLSFCSDTRNSSDSEEACASFLPRLRLVLNSIFEIKELNQFTPAMHTFSPPLHSSEIEPSDFDFHLEFRMLARDLFFLNRSRKPR